MDITKFVISGRDQALLYGDYSTYRAQLSRQLLAVRKRLGRTTKKGAKYSNKAVVTAQDIANNHEFIHLLLLTSERAWAHGMYMRSAHSGETKGITGSTRSHIISRIHKASTTAKGLLDSLLDRSTTGATESDILEARAYATSLNGAENFEKQKWEACVKSYSVAWVIYSALATATKGDLFKDLLSGTIEPSIRYGAYQMRMPRTIAIPAIAKEYFAKDDSELVAAVEKLDSGILREGSKTKADSVEGESASRTITWRSRTVELEDASIAVALAAVSTAARHLSEALSSTSVSSPRERAAAYDDILITSQDAVDATKHAIDELTAEGVGQGDKRMQSLQITRTAVSYDMISWRIGRNRVLTGERDGCLPDSGQVSQRRRKTLKNGSKSSDTHEKDESSGRKLARLREKLVLYDSTLQSLDSIRELPGVAADTKFIKELDAKYNYFRALKCLAIARSYSTLSEHKNALALLARATDLSSKALPVISSLPAVPESSSTPPNLSISSSEVQSLSELLQGELQRHRGLVELTNLSGTSNKNSTPNSVPLVERLNTYPSDGVDLKNLVAYPPKLEPVPVKPLFFDVAWNYIEYPGRKVSKGSENIARTSANAEKTQEPAKQEKKGWFGFGR